MSRHERKYSYGGSVFVINKKLVEKQNIDDETLEQMKKLYAERDEIVGMMRVASIMDFQVKLRRKFAEWIMNEYAIQILWGFKADARYHSDYLLPGCTCPKMENRDSHGTSVRYYSCDCQLHNAPQNQS